jgi:hypothetical protein
MNADKKLDALGAGACHAVAVSRITTGPMDFATVLLSPLRRAPMPAILDNWLLHSSTAYRRRPEIAPPSGTFHKR